MADTTRRRRTAAPAKDSALDAWLRSAPPEACDQLAALDAALGRAWLAIPRPLLDELDDGTPGRLTGRLQAPSASRRALAVAERNGDTLAAVWHRAAWRASLLEMTADALHSHFAAGAKSMRGSRKGQRRRRKPEATIGAALALADKLRSQGTKAEAAEREVQIRLGVSPAALRRYRREAEENLRSTRG